MGHPENTRPVDISSDIYLLLDRLAKMKGIPVSQLAEEVLRAFLDDVLAGTVR